MIKGASEQPTFHGANILGTATAASSFESANMSTTTNSSADTASPAVAAAAASESSALSLPPGTQLLHDQVAGHKFGQCKFKFGLLRHTASGDVLKPVCDRRSERELQFYREVFQDDDGDAAAAAAGVEDRCRTRLRTFVPRFNGVHHDAHYEMDYIRLGDVLAQMVRPSVMDIKIGPKTYDPEASHEKIATEMSKYKHAAVMGFRILGMRIHQPDTDDYLVRDKNYGLTVTEQDAASILLTFTRGDSRLMSRLLSQVESIREWFEQDNIDRYKFISSSLLFAYGRRTQSVPDQVDVHVKMIDFAHVFPNVGRDENYLEGLMKLVRFLRQAAAAPVLANDDSHNKGA